MAQGTCTVDGCDRVEQLRRKMCQMHYWRWKKYGTTDERHYTCSKNHVLSPDNITVVRGERHCAACLAEKPPADPCAIEDCDDPQLARGWCRKHYLRWYRLGDTGTPPRFTLKPCLHSGCPLNAVKLGLCVKHHARLKAWGTTDDPPLKPLRCKVDGCLREPKALGWCKPHYKKFTGQGTAHEMKRYALKCGSQVEDVDYEIVIAMHGMVCHICGDSILSRDDCEIDHVIPLSRKGPHIYANLRPSHKSCNRRKSNKLMSELIL